MTLGVSTAALLSIEKIGFTKKACETYQGYSNTLDGNIGYVFDDKKLEERTSDPNYFLVGSYKLKDELKIGDRYCFLYQSPVLPWAEKRLKSIRLERNLVGAD